MRTLALFITAAITTTIQASPTYTTFPYVNNAIETAVSNMAEKFHVGDIAQGGVIFWVDSSGQHGLVAALTDADHNHSPFPDDTIPWLNDNTTLVFANQNAIGAGFTNSTLIVAGVGAANQLNADFAAMDALVYGATDQGVYCRPPDVGSADSCHGNFYLASEYEMQLLATALCNPTPEQIGAGFIPLDGGETGYWTSTMYTHNKQYTDAYMYQVALSSGGVCAQSSALADRTLRKRVRPIRSF